MDVFSHALLGFILGQALQLDRYLQLILIVSSISLDIDAISIRGHKAAFKSHRGPLHSIFAAFLASALISTGYIIIMRLPPTAFLPVTLISLAGFLGHLVLDILTTGKMVALWPFSKRNFAFNLTYFIDPIFIGALLMAVILIIYAKTDVNTIKIVAAASITFLTVNSGLRCYMKNAATKIIKGLDDGVASSILSVPTLRPDRWLIVRKISFENGYRCETYRIDSIHKKILAKDTESSAKLTISQKSDFLSRIRQKCL